LGLQSHVQVALDVSQELGNLTMRWPEGAREDERLVAIVETARLATAQIASQYPQHVRVKEEPDA
jgi:uncharacterized protein YsxB (DUF464 family)